MTTVLPEIDISVDLETEKPCEAYEPCPGKASWLFRGICSNCGPVRVLYCNDCAMEMYRDIEEFVQLLDRCSPPGVISKCKLIKI